MAPRGFEDKVAFVWKVADKLRGTFKQHEYGSVMLPLLVLRRMDAVLAPTKQAVLDAAAGMSDIGEGQDAVLKRTAGQRFYNTSPLTFQTLLNDDKHLAEALAGYVRRLSRDADAVMEAYNLDDKITRMDRAGILYAVLSDFADLDLRPSVVSNEAMGYIFEELLRKFSEMSNETAGEHYTPREVIRLMVDLLLTGRTAAELTDNPKPVRTVYDPAAGTGGMLMGTLHRIGDLNDGAVVRVYGQELNDETWAIAQSDLMMQDIDPSRWPTATPSPPTPSPPRSSTSSWPTRPMGWTGRHTPPRSSTSTRSSALLVGSVPACRGSRTGRCCSSSTCCRT
jgi:type I restriction enzyme M protein